MYYKNITPNVLLVAPRTIVLPNDYEIRKAFWGSEADSSWTNHVVVPYQTGKRDRVRKEWNVITGTLMAPVTDMRRRLLLEKLADILEFEDKLQAERERNLKEMIRMEVEEMFEKRSTHWGL